MSETIRENADQTTTIIKLLPNIVTLTSLCIALTAILHSFHGKYYEAAGFLLFAGFMDGLDGRLARYLNSSSDFGAQLDSLVDFANFSIVPGIVIYFWVLHYGFDSKYAWSVVLFYVVCGAIRLARFNVDLGDDETSKLKDYFFKGIPAPAGAALLMFPIILNREFGEGIYDNPELIIAYSTIIGFLMASTVPTLSLKKIPIRNDFFYLTLVFLGLLIIGLLSKPWFTLVIIGLIYLISIPITIISYLGIKNKLK
ncbi:MAG: phosphatidylcholine/phosphatidylserine synthase [Rickettsiales bacterium]|nr:phosphatidylcholine/phosphatidylserine synthase [Rickettsiales bacterium]